MALDWLPAARRAPIAGQPGFPWQTDCPPKILWHTTEGGNGVPSYTPGFKAPHATVLPRPGVGVDVVQHIPLTLASYSLVHAAGTPPTNGAHVFQFELAGTSEKGGPGLYWPDADDVVLADLYRKVAKPIQDAYGVQLVAPPFKAYPASYGANNGVRLSGPAFLAWRGHLGHQHAPGNDHGDPGLFPWARLVAAAGNQPLVVDGVLGTDTIRRWQTVLNTLVVKPQLATDGKLGPATWTAVQRWLGHTPVNGVPGRDTIRDLERRLGMAVADGVLGTDTIRALQRWLNAQPAKTHHTP